MPHSYAILYGAPKRCSRRFERGRSTGSTCLTPNAHGPDRVGLTGPDVSEPEDHLTARVEEFNRDPKAPFVMRMAVPADYEAVVAGRTDRPVFKGELNPIFQGIYSSRIELKAWMRLMERQLLTAEKLSVARRPGWARPPIWTASGRAGSRCSSTRRTTWPRAS